MKKILLVVLAVAVFMSGTSMSMAYSGGHEKCGSKQGMDKKILKKAHFMIKNQEELGLTDEQVGKIKTIKIAAKKDLIKMKADIDIIAVDIKAAMYADIMDIEAVNKLIDQKYEMKKAKAKSLVNTCANFKNILTDEQKDKMKTLSCKQK